MKTTIYFYTGTGNSLWTAGQIAGRLDPSELIPLEQSKERLCFLRFGAYRSGFPRAYLGGTAACNRIYFTAESRSEAIYFCCCRQCRSSCSNAYYNCERFYKRKHLHLACGFSIDLPSNYIPWGGAIHEDKQQKKFTAALDKMRADCDGCPATRRAAAGKGPLLAQYNFFDDLSENLTEGGQNG